MNRRFKRKVIEIEQVHKKNPSQWEGRTSDEKMFHVDYQFGGLKITISKDPVNYKTKYMEMLVLFNSDLKDEEYNEISFKSLKKIMESIGFLF